MRKNYPGRKYVVKCIRHHCPLIDNFTVLKILKRTEDIWDGKRYEDQKVEELIREAIFLVEMDEIDPEGRR